MRAVLVGPMTFTYPSMASLDNEEEYSDEEEEDWQDQDLGGEGGLTGWNKDHQSKNSQLTEIISVSEFKTLCREKIRSVVTGEFGVARPARSANGRTIAKEMGLTVAELTKLKAECK